MQDSSTQQLLRDLVSRIERLEEDRRIVSADLRVVYGEAKAHGFDTRILRKLIALRKKDATERAEEEAVMSLYLNALGMIGEDSEGKTSE